MNPTEPGSDSKHGSPGKAGWSTRLSQKLKPSSARNNKRIFASQDDLAQQDIDSYSTTTEPTDTQMTFPTDQELGGDVIGLDSEGKASRKSNASNEPLSPTKKVSLPNPLTSNHNPRSTASMIERDGRAERGSYEGNRDEITSGRTRTSIGTNDLSLAGSTSQGDSPTQYTGSHAVRRKEVPITRGTEDSVDSLHRRGYVSTGDTRYDKSSGIAHGNPETDLPIATEFTSHRTGVNTRSSLDAAREILNPQTSGTQIGTRVDDTDSIEKVTKDVGNLGLNSPGSSSPASFVSANENASGAKTKMQSKYHPSAEEIIERAKSDSVDTTQHNTMAPAVTHEVVQKRVHEVTEKRITRDIHHYHHVHRILPVHSVEVLPAKHYRIVDGVQVEMKPEEVPQSRVDAWESTIVPKIDG